MPVLFRLSRCDVYAYLQHFRRSILRLKATEAISTSVFQSQMISAGHFAPRIANIRFEFVHHGSCAWYTHVTHIRSSVRYQIFGPLSGQSVITSSVRTRGFVQSPAHLHLNLGQPLRIIVTIDALALSSQVIYSILCFFRLGKNTASSSYVRF